MLASLLNRLLQTVIQRPRSVLLATAVTVVVAAGLGMGIELRTSTRELVPAGDATQTRWDALRADFHDPDPLILVVEGGSEAERRRLVDTVVAAAQGVDEIASVNARVDLEWMAERVLWLAPADDLEASLRQFEEILGGDPVAQVAGFDDLNRRLAARLESAIAEGNPATDDAVNAAARLQALLAVEARFLSEPEALIEGLPADIAVVVSRSGDGIDGVVGSTGMNALQRGETAVVVHVDEQPLALESGGVGMESEVDDRFDLPTHPLGRDLSGEAEPRGRPRRTPLRPWSEGLEVIEVRAGLDAQGAGVGMREREDPLPQLPLDPFLDEVPVRVHRPTLFRRDSAWCAEPPDWDRRVS